MTNLMAEKVLSDFEELFKTYSEADSGKWGKTFERMPKRNLGMKDKVSKPGQVDFRRNRTCYEMKTGGGELGSVFNSRVRYVVYVPVVRENLETNQQEGFLLERETFLRVIEEAGLLRRKVTTRGSETVSIQTFWNHKKNEPHGSKYYTLLDLLYENSLMTWEEFYNNGCKL